MGEPVETAYIAVERAYGEGQFSAALEQATVLLPQLEAGRPDLLDLRLQLLIGHIHCYGLQQPAAAAAAYRLVLEQSSDAAYQALARQGLELCQSAASEPAVSAQEPDPQRAVQPELQEEEEQQPPPPEHAAQRSEPADAPQEDTTETQAQSPPTGTDATLPATPWLSQLSDPAQALEQIQSAWSTVIPSQRRSTAARLAAETPPVPPPETSAALAVASPAVVPVQVRVEEEPAQGANPEPATNAATTEPQPAMAEGAEPDSAPRAEESDRDSESLGAAESPSPEAGPPFSPEERADYARGWLLVDLSLQPRTRR